MTKFESEVKCVVAPQDRVYAVLSDLNNLEKAKDRLPKDKVKDFTFDTDTCSFSVDPVGEVSLRIIEREPCKTIKFTTDKSPVPFFLWIQLVPMSESETAIKLTIKAELNPFIKGMVKKPLQEGLDKMVEMLATINY